MRAVHVVVPDGIDDPTRPSGGNVYDRHLLTELGRLGWAVREHAVPGFWSHPGETSFAALEAVAQRMPAGALVLVDGLIASNAPEVLVPHAARLRLIVLVHMPVGHRPPDADTLPRERAVLSAAAAVVTTSAWARRRLTELYDLTADRVHVAEPGVDAAEPATGTDSGEGLLCVAAVTRDKGHDILLDALESIEDLSWHCVCVGRLDRDPPFVETLRRRRLVDDRVALTGPQTGADLSRHYRSADLFVLASRTETYGMVVTEALARGLPVIAADVGGVGEALGHGADGIRPGMLVAPEDPSALGAAIRAWLTDAELRRRLRQAACERRATLPEWSRTGEVVAGVLAGAAR